MSELGFGPTLKEFQEIVRDYLELMEIKTNFKDNRPGYEWTSNFLKRHKLSLKKGGQMELARKSVTSDPFVIYGFFELLAKEIERLGIQDKPECLFNCDESGFPTDPSKCKYVGPVGKKCIQVTHGAIRENTTVLAVCCADGRAFDPLIIFKGKNLQSTWLGAESLKDTYYSVSDSGWMTTGIFHDWFGKFIQKVKVRPMLLLFDGHMTHLSASTIDLAMKENVTLIKLPAHCTDVLQPLDVACFSPLKSAYEKLLTEFVHRTGGRQKLNKPAFTNLIAKIWHEGLTKGNIISGFQNTGILPVDQHKYDITRLDTVKLDSYKKWKESGSPLGADGLPQVEQNEPTQESIINDSAVDNSTMQQAVAQAVRNAISPAGKCKPKVRARAQLPFSDKSFVSTCSTPGKGIDKDGQPSSSTPSSKMSQEQILELLQEHAPPGYKYCLTLVPRETDTLEKVLKSRMVPKKDNKVQEKRRRINMHAAVISTKEYKERIEESYSSKAKSVKQKAAAAKESKTKKKTSAPKSKKTHHPAKTNGKEIRKKLRAMIKESSDENENEIDFEECESLLENPAKAGTKMDTTKEVKDGDLSAILRELDDHNIGKYFAVFWPKPKAYYWGQLQKVFSEDVESDASEVEMKFLKKIENSTDPKRVKWDWPITEDVGIVSAKLCFAGPCTPEITDSSRSKSAMEFQEEDIVMRKFMEISKHGFN